MWRDRTTFLPFLQPPAAPISATKRQVAAFLGKKLKTGFAIGERTGLRSRVQEICGVLIQRNPKPVLPFLEDNNGLVTWGIRDIEG